jgi:TonB-linked SusC/RagA family outer membrane protein
MNRLYAEPFLSRRTASRTRWLLSVVILMISSLSGYAQNQKFTVNLHDASLKEIMSAIKKQSGYSFLYQDDLIANYGRRDFNIDTNRIDAVMKVILSGTNLTYEVEDNVIVLKREPSKVVINTTPVITTHGVIRDATGQSLPGVSVVVKGTTRGTVSDHEGVYVIDVREDDVLVFSFIGFALIEMPVEGRTTVDVVMQEEISKLKEVVVTGYQDIRKESFTGRAVTITGDELIKVNPVNVFQSIQAYDPSFRIIDNNLIGSNPNRLPDINVRGATGLPSGLNQVDRGNLSTNPNLPTFILDGFEVSMQTVYDMDINRIESVTLLKDAAATAIYGSRAANGVLVIKTKTPKEGALQFSYNYQLTASTPDLSVYDVLNAREKLDYEYLAGVYDERKNNALTQEQYDELYYEKKRLVLSGVDSYWLSEPVRTSYGHKNSLTIEGGAKTIRYGVTAQMQTMPGVMKGSDRKRYGGDVYLSYNLNDKFLFKNTLSVSQVSGRESPYGSFEDYVKMNPYYPKYDENGKVIRKLDEWTRVYNDAVTGEGSLRTDDPVLNPAYEATLSSFDKSRYTQFINSFSTNWNIREGLMLKGVISLTRYLGTQDTYTSPLSNQFYSYSTSDYSKRGSYVFAQSDLTTIDGNVILSYNKQINRHLINASMGGNLKENTSSQKSFQARGFTNDRFDNISFANSYYENDSPQGLDAVDRLVGSILAVNYSFDNRFLLDLSARLDGSSKFGTDKKYAPFWAAGIGWNLHHEKFLASVPTINQLRITATTGLTGGVSFPPYLGKTTYEYYNDWYSTGVGATTLGYGNDNLKWQRTQNYELGLNAIALDRRITFSGAYYTRLTKDLIADIGVTPSMGFASYKDNLGEMENKG